MNNRIAFVTGASRGIGRACALALSESGARVVLAARSLDKLEEVAVEIRSAGREAFVVEVDLSSANSIRDAFSQSAKDFGPAEILVNNAGITRDGLAVRSTGNSLAKRIQRRGSDIAKDYADTSQRQRPKAGRDRAFMGFC